MTRQDYEALADAFRRAMAAEPNDTAYRAGVEQARWEVSRKLAADNPRFSYDRFMAACEAHK